MKKGVNVQQTLAELIYYNDNPKGEPFEKLDTEIKRHWVSYAGNILICIDKMNMTLTKKIDPKEKQEQNRKSFNYLYNLVQGFVQKLKTTKPELFPCEELVHKLMEE